MTSKPATPQEYDEDVLKELGLLAINLSKDQKTGRAFRKLVKQVDPGRVFPADEVQDLREEMTARDEARELKTAQDKLLAKQELERQQLTEKYSDEQIKEIEAVMTAHGIASYATGAKLYAAELKPTKANARDVLTGGRTWSLPAMEGLVEDPAKFALNESAKVIDEIRAGVFNPGG